MSDGVHGNDSALIARVQNGDERALEELHIAFWPSLVNLAQRYLHDVDMARDVVQDVYADIWFRHAEWAPRGTIASYLYGAVRNRAISVSRREKVIHGWDTGSSELDEIAASTTSVSDHMEVSELDTLLRIRLKSLPARCRETYLLYRGGDLTVAEVARVMGVSTETAKTQIRRAVAALQKTVDRYYGE